MNKEEIIKNLELKLDISRKEAEEVYKADLEISRMTQKELVADLTEEQRKNSKQARQSGRKPTVYKFDTTKRQKKKDESKSFLISTFENALSDIATSLEVTNEEREIVFMYNDTKYKLTLSAPRS